MRFLRQGLTGLLLLSLALGLLVIAAALVRDAVRTRLEDTPTAPPARERVFAVNVEPVISETVTPVLTVFGEIRSRRALEIRASVPGTLIELAANFEEGGEVEAGALLARIDPADADAALARAETDLADARAEQREATRALDLARDDLQAARSQATLREQALARQSDLSDRGVGSAAAVETAELAVAAAQQAVLARRQAVAEVEARIDQAATRRARAEIAVDEARRDRADTEIRAKFSGTLGDVDVVAGRLVSQNERLADLIDLEALEVAFRVSTRQFVRLLDEEGALAPAPVTIMLEGAGTELASTGTLSRAGAAVGEGQTGRLLFADLEDARGFKPGDFVTVRIEEPAIGNVARLPASAVSAAGEVLVVGAEERLRSASVKILRRQGDSVLVRAPELEGQSVVAARTPLLGDGIRIRPLRGPDSGLAPDAMLELSDERRARLVAFIEGNTGMPDAARARLLAQLERREVSADVVRRLESRIGG